MFKWIVIVAFILAGGIFGYVYYVTNNSASAPIEAFDLNAKPIVVVDAYKDGFHRVSGSVRLPHSCFALDTSVTHDPTDPSIVTVVLRSRDITKDPANCVRYATQYSFETLIDASENITIHLVLDDKELRVWTRYAEWQSPRGGVIDSNSPI